MRRTAALLIIIGLGAAAAFWYLQRGDSVDAVDYRLVQVDRGAIELVVSATGHVHPVMIVDIGSQVSGQVAQVLADFNSKVAAGQVIAQIDPAPFEARVQVAQADLAFAKANVVMQEAVLDELQAELAGARAALAELAEDLKRQRALLQRKVVSQSIVDRAVAQRDQARARVDALQARLRKQQAQVGTALAQVDSRRGRLRESELDLDYTVIRSPVAGIVVNRDVAVGQTVAASLQAPVLFTVAQDLKDVQLEISVDEADIGRVFQGQTVRFSVDAFPERTFSGKVTQIRKQPVEVSGVVTYQVIVATRNDDEVLLPGMTATVEIIVGRREDVLRVADAALRFTPKGVDKPAGATPGSGAQRGRARLEKLAKDLGLRDDQRKAVGDIFREMGQSIGGLRAGGMEEQALADAIRQLRAQAMQRVEVLLDDAQKTRYQQLRAEATVAKNRQATLWKPGGPTAVPVVVGLSDGTHTQVVSGEITQGDQVIAGLAPASR